MPGGAPPEISRACAKNMKKKVAFVRQFIAGCKKQST
jgi:hypothetical protein